MSRPFEKMQGERMIILTTFGRFFNKNMAPNFARSWVNNYTDKQILDVFDDVSRRWHKSHPDATSLDLCKLINAILNQHRKAAATHSTKI